MRPEERLDMVWEVVEVAHKPERNGEFVNLDGRVTDPAGDTVLTGIGTFLVARSLLRTETASGQKAGR